MPRYIKLSGIVSMFLLFLSSPGFSQTQSEQLIITTYYPSPYGSYRQLGIIDTDTTADRKALTVSQSGAVVGTGYAVYATKTGASTTNVGGYFSASGGTNNYGIQIPVATAAGANNYAIYSDSPAKSYFAGPVGIGTASPTATAMLEVNGRLYADLNNSGGGAQDARFNPGTHEIFYDVAELFDTSESVEPGDVLAITADKKLKKSNGAYDTSVAGIVSEAPAIIFEGSQAQIMPKPFKFTSGKKPPVALVGRVLCKVTTSNGGSIKAGDLLVTSSKPGYAMKGDPKKIQIGTVLGKAMEPLEKGEGKITVLVTLQ